MGRRGSGKSALINALFGAQVRSIGPVSAQTGATSWETYMHGGRAIEILDSRGLQEGSAPAESDSAASPEDSLIAGVRAHCPDIILFTVKAKEVDAAIAGDLVGLARVHRAAVRIHEYAPKILAVITQCDELDPSDIDLSADDPEKSEHIEQAVEVLKEHLQEHDYIWQHLARRVVPTSAKMRFEPDGTVNVRRDYRWNIDALALAIQEVLPNEAQLNFVRMAQFRVVQRRVAKNIIHVTAVVCGAIGMEPIPVADLPVLTSIQMVMILAIAYISGRDISLEAAKEFAAALGVNIGAAFTLREVARGLLKLIPAAGNAASAAIAMAGTEAIGNAAILYYIDRRSVDEIRNQLPGMLDRLLKRKPEDNDSAEAAVVPE